MATKQDDMSRDEFAWVEGSTNDDNDWIRPQCSTSGIIVSEATYGKKTNNVGSWEALVLSNQLFKGASSRLAVVTATNERMEGAKNGQEQAKHQSTWESSELSLAAPEP